MSFMGIRLIWVTPADQDDVQRIIKAKQPISNIYLNITIFH